MNKKNTNTNSDEPSEPSLLTKEGGQGERWTGASDDELSSDEIERPHLTGVDTKLALAKKIIARLREDLRHLESLVTSEADPSDIETLMKRTPSDMGDMFGPMGESKIIEGVFDGQNMIGADGHQYIVPPNYASKSKLVEGDILKLTIQPNGTFLYKQIGPIERQRAVGTITLDEITNDWKVSTLGKKYTVLAAAISYHKGDVGDEAVILIPKEAPSKWAAVENVIKK